MDFLAIFAVANGVTYLVLEVTNKKVTRHDPLHDITATLAVWVVKI